MDGEVQAALQRFEAYLYKSDLNEMLGPERAWQDKVVRERIGAEFILAGIFPHWFKEFVKAKMRWRRKDSIDETLTTYVKQ